MVGLVERQEENLPVALRVLIVEDSEDDAMLLLSELRRGGYEPYYERVEIPEAMKKALADSVWDVIVSDYRMPRFEAPKALAMAREAGSEAPFIVVSGKIGEDVAVEMMKAGAHDCVMKDKLARLCPTVERGLEEAKERRERWRAEEELRGSEERYRAVIEQATDGVYLLDSDTRRLLETNPSFQKMLGYAADELQGMEVYNFVAHARPNIDSTISTTLEQKRRLVGDRQYRRKDGSLMDVEVGVSVISYGGKEVICTIVRDVTERKRYEETLRQSERLYRTVIEQVTENICLVDVETRRLVEFNPTFQKTLGYTADELRRRTLYDIVVGDWQSIDRNIRLVLERKRYFVGERQYRHKDGSLIDVEVSASTFLLDDKTTLCIVAHDITERTRVQGLLQQRVTTLTRISADLTLDRPIESTLSILAESVVNASTAVACAVVLVDAKADTLHLFGSYGLPEGYTDGLRAAYRTGVQSPALRAFHTRQPVLIRDIRRFLLAEPLYSPIHRFVREVPWDTTYNLPLIYRGQTLGVIFFCFLPEQEPGEDEEAFLKAVVDQTAVAVENARLFAEAHDKAALEERQRLARELHDSVSQALYGIALGTKTARTLLSQDPDQAAEPLDYVLSLSEAGLAEMRALIFELRPESLETEGLVAALEKQVAALEARHGIAVESILCNEPMVSLETKEAIYRIVQEALHNTVKHARATNVRIRMECNPEWITLDISDDGVGFDVQGDFPGHLGLHSMRERASRLGGTLEIESAPGRETRIYTRIPV